jgi:hypothetical protein
MGANFFARSGGKYGLLWIQFYLKGLTLRDVLGNLLS